MSRIPMVCFYVFPHFCPRQMIYNTCEPRYHRDHKLSSNEVPCMVPVPLQPPTTRHNHESCLGSEEPNYTTSLIVALYLCFH